MILLRIFLLYFFYAKSLESDIKMNAKTKGLENILVVIDSQIKSEDCKDLLLRIKVTNFAGESLQSLSFLASGFFNWC